MLDERELDEFFGRHFRRAAFRLEARDSYAVASDGGDLARYLAGDDAPDPDRKNAWLDELRADTAAGKRWQWVHVVYGPLSDYLRYEFEWGYAVNIHAGAEVRILDLAEHRRPSGLLDEDFWLLDDEAVLIMRYDARGQFLGAEPADPGELSRYRRAHDVAWQAATPFASYWAAHPGYHRRVRAA
ncbi:MAG: DUF6879 family protein [Streptosporangiaceae bacterium]